MARRVAIIGVGISKHKRQWSDVCLGEMCDVAVREAMADANLTPKDIDAYVMGNMPVFEAIHYPEMQVLDYVGATMKPVFHLQTAGTTGGTIVNACLELVASGIYDVAAVLGWQKHSESDPSATMRINDDQMYTQIGTSGGGALTEWQKLAKAYMLKYPYCTDRHAAMVRLRADKNACKNPKAHLQLRLQTIEDVMKSPMLQPPVRLLDSCPASDGAVALIIACEERATKIHKKPVWVKDWTIAHMATNKVALQSPLPRGSLTEAAGTIFKRNGITNPRRDLSVAELYTPSTWAEIAFTEYYMLCNDGEFCQLEEKGVWEMTGELPICPSGGVIATNAIGSSGVARVAETALQLRGDAGEHQITKQPHLGFATSWGGWSWSVAHLLSNKLD